ncbi:hypothetical protein Tco_1167907 [Tanacetum coccineum]
MSAKDTIAVQRCGLSTKELNEFLSSYPIPSEYDAILPKSTQTIFDAPPSYVGLYTYSFSLANLSWINFQKRSEKHIPNLLPKVITRIKGWHERFFFVKDSIISSKYPQLLLNENKLDSKSFKDKLPPNIDENLYFQRLGRCPTSVRVFDDPILFLAGLKPSREFGQQRPAIIVGGKEMDFKNFIYTEDDDDLAFLSKELSPGFDSGESSKSGVFVVHPGSVAARIKERKCKTRGCSLRPHVKRKLASGSSSSGAMRAKTSASKDDAPFHSISNDDEGLPYCFELKDANACHLKISAITPPAWRGHLDNQIDLELLDLHDRCYARQDVVDNTVNRRASAMAEFDQNPAVQALREKISSLTADDKEHKADKAKLETVEASLRGEVEELKQDRRDVVSKVVPYATMKLVHNDELGRLVGYHSSYQKEHTQASNDFATATFPWLDEFVAYVATLIEALLSKNPPTLQKLAPSRTQMPAPSSHKATMSSAPSMNPISPSANLLKPSPTPFE